MHIAEIQKKVNLNFYGKDGAPSPDHIPQPSATVTACICCHLTHWKLLYKYPATFRLSLLFGITVHRL